MQTCSVISAIKEGTKKPVFEHYFGETQQCICCGRPSVFTVSIGVKSIFSCASSTCKEMAISIINDRLKQNSN